MPRAFGAIPDIQDERDWLLGELSIDTEIPDSYSVELPEYIKLQGSKPTCVSCASALIKEYQEKSEEMSGEFIYWLAMRDEKATKTTGMYFRDALKYLQKIGELKNSLFPTDGVKWKEPVVANWEELSRNNRIGFYAKVGLSKDEIKKAIYQFGPILIGVYAVNFNVTSEIKNRVRTIDGIIKPFKTQGNPHAIVAYGYDEEGLIIRNSWGSSWGENGNAKILWDEVPKRLFAAYGGCPPTGSGG